MSERTGKVQTVLGLVDPETLGHTQTHEHLIVNLLPPDLEETMPPEEPIRMEHLFKLSQFRLIDDAAGMMRTNGKLDSEEEAIEEMHRYRAQGGGTICEATSVGINRDPAGLARISKASDINIIMGSGYYQINYQPEEAAHMSEADFEEHIIRDIEEGADGTGIRAGMIGEIGLSWPVHPQEARVLAGSARAQQRSGAALMIHPGRDARAPIEAVQAIEKAGGNPARTIMCHIDRTLFTIKDMCELAATGCILEFDLFGWETSYYPPADIDMPNDATRIDYLKALFDAGYGEQLVISQDTFAKTHLIKYGGHGYSHILEHVLPMMERKGFGKQQVRAVCVENPRNILTFE